MNAVVRSGIARVWTMVPVVLATLLLSRVIIDHYGLAAYSAFSLSLALINLVPLNDLGVGAAVTSTFAAEGPDSERSYRVTLTATRVLTISSMVTVLITVVITVADLWPTLLGDAAGPNLGYGIAVAVYALSFVFGLGMPMLLGIHRNHSVIVVQALTTPLVLVMAYVVIVTDAPELVLLVLPPTSLLMVGVIATVIAVRATGLPWRTLVAAVPRRRSHPGGSIRNVSGPMLIITLVVPIALQLDRIVLSQISTATAVATYALAFQIMAPALALAAALGQPLWPIYEQARGEGRPGPSLPKMTLLFTGGALLAAVAMVLAFGPLADIVSAGKIDMGWQVPIASGCVVVAMAASAPLTSIMMDPQGLRLLAVNAVLGAATNVGLSIVLIGPLGAAGPIWARFVVLAVPFLPLYLFAARRQARVAAGGVTPGAADPGRHRRTRGSADRRAERTPS